jgi:tetratricopeptide (TPR) repeat protein
MNIRLQLVIGGFSVLVGTALRAQCPDRQIVYGQLEQVSLLADAVPRIRELSRLEQQCIRCHQTADSVYAKVLHVLGRSHWKAGDLVRGEAYTKKAITINSIRSVLTSKANLSNSFNNLGQILAEQNKYREAFEAFDQSVQIARLYPDRYKVGATTLAKYAHLLFLLGDYDKAVQRGEQGYELAKQAGEPLLIVQNLVEMSQALIRLNRYAKAKGSLTEALPIAQTINDPTELSNTLSLMGMLYEATGQKNEAVSYYQKAFVVNKNDNNRYGCAQTLSSLAHFYQTTQIDYAKALSYLHQALPYTDDPNDRALLLGDIGAVYRYEKGYDKALSFYQRALLDFSIDFKDSRSTVNPEAEVIRLVRQKDYLLSTIQDKADTWLDYAKATANNHQRLQQALDTYKVADQMIDYMRWEHTGHQSKLYWRDKAQGMYERAIETCYLLGDVQQAFRFLEKSRAVMLADKLNELGARQKLTQPQILEEQQLQQAVSKQQNKLATIPADNNPAYKAAQMALFAKQDSLTTFLKNLEASNPAYYRYKYDTTTTSLAALQQHMKKQSSSLITYFVGDSALYLLAVTRRQNRIKKAIRQRYNQALHQFDLLLSDPAAMSKRVDVKRFLSLSNDLYRQLLAPLALPKGRVVVSPDGFFIPFDALSRSATTPNYVVSDYAFSYVYSAGLLLKNAGAANSGIEF